jgi:membrane-associated phospholipid phosphatase
MITYIAIALLVPVKQRNRAISVGIGLALALQAGWSRVALGVHWPSDVLGGLGLWDCSGLPCACASPAPAGTPSRADWQAERRNLRPPSSLFPLKET